MRVKDEIVHRKTRLRLYFKQDYKDVESWPEDDCEDIAGKLKDYILDLSLSKPSYVSDRDICPQCQKSLNDDAEEIASDAWTLYSLNCASCSYGKRHGMCDTIKSNRYDMILSRTNYETIADMLLNKDSRKEENLQKLLDCLK